MKSLGNDAMKELVEMGRLKRADILLTRTKGSLLGRLIRFGTDSYWNHALMVYTIKDDKQGYNSTFIIESGGSGIDIHNIAHYLKKPDKYDVAVKRLETDWLDENKGNGLHYCRKVRGFALQEIDDKYDHRMIMSIAARIIRQLILAFLFPLQRRKKQADERRVQVSRFAGMNVNAYICSGFVQWSYYQAMSQLLDDADPDKSKKLQRVIFNPVFISGGSVDTLLSTTPADLANNDKLSWKYVIKDGALWEVSSKEEVDVIVRPEK